MVKTQLAKILFERLQQSGLIKKQRKGAGNQYVVERLNELQVFANNEYPNGLLIKSMPDIPSRTKGVLLAKNSKHQKSLDFSLVTLRGNIPLMHSGKTYNLQSITSTNSGLCLKLSPESWCKLPTSPCTVITVENPTAFLALEKIISAPWQLAIYTAGKMPKILLQQLQLWYQQGHQLIHFGDYDYVGLLEFARILNSCPMANLYYPDSIDELLQQYGHKHLLEKQTEQHSILANHIKQLAESSGKNQLLRIYTSIQSSAKGLEQEVLIRQTK